MEFFKIAATLGNELMPASKLALTFAMKYAMYDAKQIAAMFKETLDNYHNKNDWIERMFLQKAKNAQSATACFHSTFIFQNLYAYIDQTDCFNRCIKNGKLLAQLQKMLSENDFKFRRNYKDQTLADKHEILCEFIELIQSKRNQCE